MKIGWKWMQNCCISYSTTHLLHDGTSAEGFNYFQKVRRPDLCQKTDSMNLQLRLKCRGTNCLESAYNATLPTDTKVS